VIQVVELGDWTCTVVQRWQFVGFKHCISTVSHFQYLIVKVFQSGRCTLTCCGHRYTNDEVNCNSDFLTTVRLLLINFVRRFQNIVLLVLFSKNQKMPSVFFIIKPVRCTNFTDLFWHDAVRVSDSSSVQNV
jgi:hypothetical protein